MAGTSLPRAQWEKRMNGDSESAPPLAVRDVWPHEARDLTPWLASTEGLALLGGVVDLQLENPQMEVSVGPFRADIVCTNEREHLTIVVESQLEPTDHRHLGQIIVYAAGLRADVVIWVAERFRRQHAVALHWLNEMAPGGLRFFGVRVSARRDASGLPSPTLDVKVHPDRPLPTWQPKVPPTRTASRGAARVRRSSNGGRTMPAQEMRFWEAFGAFLESRRARFPRVLPAASGQQAQWALAERRGVSIRATARMHDRPGPTIFFDVRGKHRLEWIDALYQDREAIEEELDFEELRPEQEATRNETFGWNLGRTQKTNATIWTYLPLDLQDPATWEKAFAWMLEHMEAFDLVLRPRIERLIASAHR